MKAFKQYYRSRLDGHGNPVVDHSDYFQQAEGWKAALEWVKTQRSGSFEADGSVSYANFVFIDKIDEELESE